MMRSRTAILALIMALCLLCACTAAPTGGGQGETLAKQDAAPADGTGGTGGDLSQALAGIGTEPAESAAGPVAFTGVDYLMVYNPLLFNELTGLSNACFTGKIGDQLDADGSRADDDEALVIPPTTIAQNFFAPVDLSPLDPNAGSRADGEQPVFSEGDARSFLCHKGGRLNEAQVEVPFTCVATGEYCNVWSAEDCITVAAAKSAVSELDERIYATLTEHFGEARFVDAGAKLNIIIYDLGDDGICGYFSPYELFTKEEAEVMGIVAGNCDLPIIHVNYRTMEMQENSFFSTITHEFQHLINFSETIKMYMRSNGQVFRQMDTWINEGMSMYSEDLCYAGTVVEQNYVENANRSRLIATGTSLYHFKTVTGDIGVYGQTYLFSQYLLENCGPGTFTRVHALWSGSEPLDTYTVAGALRTAVPESFAKQVEESVTYSEAVTNRIGDPDSVFLSKLTIDFHIACVVSGEEGIYSLGPVGELSYPNMFRSGSGIDIEGGGRILLPLVNGSYIVPEDANPYLIYVGFDAEGQVVMPPTTAADYAA